MGHHAILYTVEQPLEWRGDDSFSCEREFRVPQITIADVRTLTEQAHRRPATGTTQTILVATEFITEEAQQALLKLIEEPPVSTKFVFVLPFGYTLLPTLESRFERQEGISMLADTSVFQTFLESSYAERMSAIDESSKKKDHGWQAAIKRGLLAHLRTNSKDLPHKTLKELEYVARLLLTRGASNKFLLEHLALTLS